MASSNKATNVCWLSLLILLDIGQLRQLSLFLEILKTLKRFGDEWRQHTVLVNVENFIAINSRLSTFYPGKGVADWSYISCNEDWGKLFKWKAEGSMIISGTLYKSTAVNISYLLVGDDENPTDPTSLEYF